MLDIAICDDEIVLCEIINEKIREYGKGKDLLINVETYYSGASFIERAAWHHFDAVFLDIEMEEINGIEVGCKIRQELDNQEMQIIYISSKETYLRQMFEVRPMNFLSKPLDQKMINDSLDLLRHLQSSYKKWFEYEKNNVFYRERIADILYFESEGRKVRMVTLTDEIIFYSTLKDIEKQLKDQWFLYIHNSFYVNYHAVKILQYKQLTLTNGLVLPISQKYRVQVAKYSGR